MYKLHYMTAFGFYFISSHMHENEKKYKECYQSNVKLNTLGD